MLKRRLIAMLSAMGVALALLVIPAGAELSSNPTSDWGVTGLATGTQTDTIKSHVFAIEQIGNRIFVGGRFLQVTNGNQTENQPFLAAFDANTGDWISSFTPTLNNAVNTLEASPDGSKLFVGGDFSTANGSSSRRRVVAINPNTGATVDGWAGRINSGSTVRGMEIDGPWLYVGGTFTAVSGGAGGTTSVSRLARFNWQTGAHDATWNPTVSGGSVWGISRSPSFDRVYIAGYFDTVNGQDRTGGFAAINTQNDGNTPGLAPLPVNNVNRTYAYDVAAAGGYVWVAGSEHYVQALNESDLSQGFFHLTDPTGDFQDLEVVGGRVYGGSHSRANSTIETTNDGVLWFGQNPNNVPDGPIIASSITTWVTAFTAGTGLHDPAFYPSINSTGPGIWAIHGSPDGCVWFGGTMNKSAGQDIYNLLRLCEPGGGGGDTERPSTPGRPQIAGDGDGSVDLTWNSSTDNVAVTGYNVYNAANDQIVLTSSSTSGTFTAADGTYSLYTRAFDAAGNLSWRSGNTSVTVTSGGGGGGAPEAVASCVVTNVGGGSLEVSWPAAANADAYRVYRSVDGGTVYWRGKASTSPFTDTDRNGVLEYTVISVAADNSTVSAATTCTNDGGGGGGGGALEAPASCAVALVGGSIDVTWPAAANAVDYIVRRNIDGGTDYWRGKVQTTSFTDTNRTGTIQYKVSSKGADGAESSRTTCTPTLP